MIRYTPSSASNKAVIDATTVHAVDEIRKEYLKELESLRQKYFRRMMCAVYGRRVHTKV